MACRCTLIRVARSKFPCLSRTWEAASTRWGDGWQTALGQLAKLCSGKDLRAFLQDGAGCSAFLSKSVVIPLLAYFKSSLAYQQYIVQYESWVNSCYPVLLREWDTKHSSMWEWFCFSKIYNLSLAEPKYVEPTCTEGKHLRGLRDKKP